MTAMKNLVKLSWILVISISLFSCSDGEDGAIGPEGQAGEQGEQGPTGEQGDTGTANVIYSDWIPSEFDANIIATGSSFIIDAPSLTDEIIDRGVILVYGKTKPQDITNDQDVIPLPIDYFGSRQQSYRYRAEGPGELGISVGSTDGGSVGETLFDEYRYVLIPGGIPAAPSAPGTVKSKVNYTTMSYQQITILFNIPE